MSKESPTGRQPENMWKKLFNKVEEVIDTALAKRVDTEPQEITPPPITDEDYQPLIADKVIDIVMARLGHGDPIAAGIRPVTVASECPVCKQRRKDAIIAGFNEEYLDFSGEFNEERFRSSLHCRRCGMRFGDSPEKIRQARKEWVELSKDAECEDDIRRAAERKTREAIKNMYSFTTDDKKTRE